MAWPTNDSVGGETIDDAVLRFPDGFLAQLEEHIDRQRAVAA